MDKRKKKVFIGLLIAIIIISCFLIIIYIQLLQQPKDNDDEDKKSTEIFNQNPCWSPDGRYIAFSSTRTGSSKIFVMNANGFNQRPLTPSRGGESSPAWSRRFE